MPSLDLDLSALEAGLPPSRFGSKFCEQRVPSNVKQFPGFARFRDMIENESSFSQIFCGSVPSGIFPTCWATD